ncbi:HAD-IB family hydrolase [bacterium]|nr:HAD-IB family hydrolase [bacterium]
MKKTEKSFLKIAVFDVDRTFLVKTTGETQLIRFLLKKRMLPLLNLFKYVYTVFRRLPRGIEEAILRNKTYLSNLDVQKLKSVLPEFFEKHLQPKFSIQLQKWIHELREKDYQIIFISGTVDFIVDLLVDYLGADGGIGSTMETQKNRFTGRILGIHPYFNGKIEALYQFLDGRNVDYDSSFGFADSWADVPLLSLFGNPIAVNPGLLLRIKARKNRWKMIWD